MTYIRPQVLTRQEFQLLNSAVVQRQNAFILGPHYQLFRFTEAAEKGVVGLGDYDNAVDQTYAYPAKPSGSTVDTAYAKLFMDGLKLQYLSVAADATNPVYVTTDGTRNVLRSAPRIGDTEKGGGGTAALTIGGCLTERVNLPEQYYFYPTDTFILGTDEGEFTLRTTEGITKTFTVPDDATTADVVTTVPGGLAADFDNAATVKSPRVITIAGATSSFTIKVRDSRIPTAIDTGLANSANRAKIKVDIATGPLAVSYNNTTKLLSVTAVTASTTVNALHAALVASPAMDDAWVDLEISDVTGAGTDAVVTAVDQDSTDVDTNTNVELLPDVWRTTMYANQYVFKTANGYNRYGDLLRDVKVGDRVRWTVTPASTGVTVTGEAGITALVADYSMATATGPDASSYNKSTVAGDDLTGAALEVTPGDDNQRAFDGANTRQNALDASILYGIGSLKGGVFSDTYTIEITTAGAKGTARATVTTASGLYTRENVLIEDAGTDDGQIYLGNNVILNLDKGTGDADALFKVGDTYSLTVTTPYTAVDNFELSGVYTGTKDTIYQVKVTNGGLFTRTAYSMQGLSTPTDDCSLTGDISNWSAGDVDDEYRLECTTAGTITAARFRLTSQRGELVSNISFAGYGSGNSRSVGVSGLRVYLEYSAAVPTFVVGNYWVLVVKASRPYVRISDSAGVDQAGTVQATADGLLLLGVRGLSITIPDNVNNLGIAASGGLATGDSFTVTATASTSAEVHTLVLDSALPSDVATGLAASGTANIEPDLIAIDLMMVRNGVEIPRENRDPMAVPGEYNWTPGTTEITVQAGLTLQDSEWSTLMGIQPFLAVQAGSMYIQYRALLTNYSNDIYALTDPSEVEDTLGPVVNDNPLAQGVYFALLNSSGVEVRYSAVTTDDSAGYGRVLELIERTSTVYGIVPTTTNESIVELVRAHVLAQSTEFNKRWRRGFFGVEADAEVAVVNSDTNPEVVDWLATVTADERTISAPITKVTFTEDASLLTACKVGDTLRFNYATDAWGNVTYSTGVVAEIDTNSVLYLETALEAPIATAEKTEVWHTNSVADLTTILAGKLANLGNRRFTGCPIWFTALGEQKTAYVGAACAAGLRSSVVPQQPLTNTEVIGPESIPATYSLFTPTQLDTLAENGGYIITQELSSGPVFVRHQLTTARAVTSDWRYAEETGTTNADSISYYFTETLAPFIGRYNLTPELIEAIRTQCQSSLRYLGSFTAVGLLGPQVDLENSEILFIGRDPVAADHLRLRVRVGQFAPLNNIDLDLVF